MLVLVVLRIHGNWDPGKEGVQVVVVLGIVFVWWVFLGNQEVVVIAFLPRVNPEAHFSFLSLVEDDRGSFIERTQLHIPVVVGE